MRFIATGDWQLGMTAHYLDDFARPRYLEARFEAVERIGMLAKEHAAEFVVVCGDVFESNQLDRKVVSQAFEAMRSCPVPIILVPGNHDPLDAASIYNSPAFRDRCLSNVHVLRDSQPFVVREGVEIIAAPWHTKRPLTDLLQRALDTLPPADPNVVRILAGHGAASTLNPEPDEPSTFDVSSLEAALAEGRIHFVAVGDKHSTTQVADRIWYPGTPEVTHRREPNPGNILLVDIDAHETRVETLHTGRWRFVTVEETVSTLEDVEALASRLDAFPDKSRTAVWLKLAGSLSTSQHARLEEILEEQGELFAKLSHWERHKDLVVLPDDADFSDLGLSGFTDTALRELVEASTSTDADTAQTAQDALGLLYRFTRGAR